MNILRNKKLSFFLVSAILALITTLVSNERLILPLIATLSFLLVYVFSLKQIKSRVDETLLSYVDWGLPALGCALWAIIFWQTNEIHLALNIIIQLSLLFSVSFFIQTEKQKTLYMTLPPALSLVFLLLVQPEQALKVDNPGMYAIGVFVISAFIMAVSWFKPEWSTEEDKINSLPESLANQIELADEATSKNTDLQEKIKKLEVELSAAEMAKMEFLATMSHEIRTPLNGIVPLIDIVLDTELNAFQKDYLSTAHTSAVQMQKLIDDLLDYSKVEAGKLTLEITGVKVKKLVVDICAGVELVADKKGLQLKTKIDPNISPLLRGDPIRIRQVLTNLLSNAVKFSERGIIELKVVKIKSVANKEILRFTVSDQGVGIDKKQIDKLFSAFTQADTSSTRKFGGTGLGLAISKKIVELLRGDIGVESELGKGSIFWFEIPLLKSAGETTAAENVAGQYQAILLNSNPLLFKNIQTKLEKSAVGVETSLNLQHALSRIKAKRNIRDNHFNQLLFIDFDTNAKLFRQMMMLVQKKELDDVLICVISESFHIAGIKLYQNIQLLQPDCDIDRILAIFDDRFAFDEIAEEQLAEEQLAEQDNVDQEASTEEKKKDDVTSEISPSVLLVEDNEVNLKVAQKLIDYIGFAFDVAENGMIALEKAKKTRFRLILMDCQMPVMDGYTCTKRIRKFEQSNKLSRTPIIAMTANAMLGDKEKCLSAGMDDYMSKPLNRYILEKTLKKWDSLANSPANSKAAFSNQQDNIEQINSEINNKWLNTKSLSEIKEFMGDETNSLLSLFQQESPLMLKKIQLYFNENNYHGIKHMCHTLKSTGANVGAMGFAHFCKKLESAAMQQNETKVKELIVKLKKAYVLTSREITKYTSSIN
ncbi:MAG: ATP-binding protein [Proteobacteria bacterium]|nr:ATP-binding protein [Pseudomonadota bacterium]